MSNEKIEEVEACNREVEKRLKKAMEKLMK